MSGTDGINVEMNFEGVKGGGGFGAGSVLDRIKAQLNPSGHSVMEIVLAALVFLLFIVVIALAASHGGVGRVAPGDPVCETDACLYRAGFLVGLTNRSANPCEDFYNYACGSSARVLPLNPTLRERTIVGEILRRNKDKLETILRAPIVRNSPDSYEYKLKTFFAKCVDDFLIEKIRGNMLATFMRPTFYVMNGSVVEKFDLSQVLQIVTGEFGAPAFFSYMVAPNRMDANKYTLSISTVGLGLHPVMYLFDFFKPQRAAYMNYIKVVTQMLVADADPGSVAAGADGRIEEFVADVMEIETQLANITRTSAFPDPGKPPLDPANQVSLADMNRLYPPFSWTSLFIQMLQSGTQDSTKLAVMQPDYLRRLSEYITERLPALKPVENRRMLSNYMHWQMLKSFTGDLSSSYVHAKREFEAALTSSSTVFPSRFDYCFERATRFRQALNGLFVADHLVDQSKRAIDAIYKTLQTELLASIDRLGWIDSAARGRAKDKTRATVDKIGYSSTQIEDGFLDEYYRDFRVTSDDYLLDMLINWQNFARVKQGSLLGKQLQKTDWTGATYDVALTMSSAAELTVPAGLLQWPMFSGQTPNFINYATIGQRIAAELIKSIDATGQMTDLNGNVNPSWSAQTLANYAEKAKCVNASFSGLQAGPYIVGNRTYLVDLNPVVLRNLRQLVAEADALRLSLAAYQATENSSFELTLPLGHLDRTQSFFVSWAQSLCYRRDPMFAYIQALLRRLMPEDVLVNGILSLIPEFGRAFQCPKGAKMAKPGGCEGIFYK